MSNRYKSSRHLFSSLLSRFNPRLLHACRSCFNKDAGWFVLCCAQTSWSFYALLFFLSLFIGKPPFIAILLSGISDNSSFWKARFFHSVAGVCVCDCIRSQALFSPPPLPHLLTFVAGICFIVSRSVLLSTDSLKTKPCVWYNHVTTLSTTVLLFVCFLKIASIPHIWWCLWTSVPAASV